MNSNNYIQAVRSTSLAMKNGLSAEDIEKILGYIDQIRRVHSKYQKELEYRLVDPFYHEYKYPDHSEKDKMNFEGMQRDIKEACISGEIRYRLLEIPPGWSEYRNQFGKSKIFASYYYKDINITDMIVFLGDKEKGNAEAKIKMLEDEQIHLKDVEFKD